MKKDIYIWVLIFVVLLLLATNVRQCKTNVSDNRAWNAISDTLSTRIDRQGKRISYIQAVNDDRRGAIKKLRYSNDSLSGRLADLIKKSGPRVVTATVFETVTKIDTQVKTISRWDTIERLDTFFLYPIYDSYLKNRWLELRISASKDSMDTGITFFNAYDIVHKTNRKGTFITIKNNNPYTSTSDIKSFTVKRKRRRLGIGIHAGIGVDLNGQITPNIGLSASYHLFQL